MKKVPSAKILDKLHRGVVITCIGLTLYGTALIGHRAYRYLTVIKPERADRELKMLEEGTMDPANLVDHAPKLRS